MKSVGVGCIGIILGLVAGIVLSFGVVQLMGTSAAEPTAPILPASAAEVSITASQPFINAQLQQAVKQTGLAKQATVTLASPDVIRVAAPVDASALVGIPVTVNATVSMRVSVQNNRIHLTIDKIDAGGMSVPQSVAGAAVDQLRASAENEINQMVQHALEGTNLHIVDVRVTPDAMTIDLSGQ
jgi:LmeA-like phospholipid-binding